MNAINSITNAHDSLTLNNWVIASPCIASSNALEPFIDGTFVFLDACLMWTHLNPNITGPPIKIFDTHTESIQNVLTHLFIRFINSDAKEIITVYFAGHADRALEEQLLIDPSILIRSIKENALKNITFRDDWSSAINKFCELPLIKEYVEKAGGKFSCVGGELVFPLKKSSEYKKYVLGPLHMVVTLLYVGAIRRSENKNELLNVRIIIDSCYSGAWTKFLRFVSENGEKLCLSLDGLEPPYSVKDLLDKNISISFTASCHANVGIAGLTFVPSFLRRRFNKDLFMSTKDEDVGSCWKHKKVNRDQLEEMIIKSVKCVMKMIKAEVSRINGIVPPNKDLPLEISGVNRCNNLQLDKLHKTLEKFWRKKMRWKKRLSSKHRRKKLSRKKRLSSKLRRKNIRKRMRSLPETLREIKENIYNKKLKDVGDLQEILAIPENKKKLKSGVYVFPAKHGDLTVIVCKNYGIIIDAGPPFIEVFKNAWSEVISHLNEIIIVLTHHDEDHIGGFQFLLRRYLCVNKDGLPTITKSLPAITKILKNNTLGTYPNVNKRNKDDEICIDMLLKQLKIEPTKAEEGAKIEFTNEEAKIEFTNEGLIFKIIHPGANFLNRNKLDGKGGTRTLEFGNAKTTLTDTIGRKKGGISIRTTLANSNSVVCVLTAGEKKFLFTADAALVDVHLALKETSTGGPFHYMDIPHHGSGLSCAMDCDWKAVLDHRAEERDLSPPNYDKWLNCDNYLISSDNSKHDHPAPKVVKELVDTGKNVYVLYVKPTKRNLWNSEGGSEPTCIRSDTEPIFSNPWLCCFIPAPKYQYFSWE